MYREDAIKYLQKLPADEPVFVLRAQDLHAPATVGGWATICLSYNDRNPSGESLYPDTLRKGRRAQELAEEMRTWQAEHGCKVPD